MTAAWMTARALRRPAVVATHVPGSTGPRAIASVSISWPPRLLMAPATPPPIQKALLAALTIASTDWAVMSPSTISIEMGGIVNVERGGTAAELPIARQDVVGQRQQRVTLGARRKRG